MEDEDNFIKGIFYYEIFFLKYNIYMFSKYNPKSIFFLYGGSTNILLDEKDIQNGDYDIHWLEKWLEKSF